jgi:HAD superfamily hydrolase (TIGR01490 family)
VHSALIGKLQCDYGEMMHLLSIFDMDKTLTRRATFFPFVWHVIRHDAPWRAVMLPLMGLTSLLYLAGLLSRSRLKEVNLRLLMGERMDPERLTRIAERFAGETLASNMLAPALARIAADRAEGRRVILATASYRLYVDAIAARLGIDDVIATRCRRDRGGSWLALIEGENCYGEAKLRMVEAWLEANSISRAEAEIRFYSDHVSDAPCLAWADQGFATNPHAPLRERAALEGWEVLEWV